MYPFLIFSICYALFSLGVAIQDPWSLSRIGALSGTDLILLSTPIGVIFPLYAYLIRGRDFTVPDSVAVLLMVGLLPLAALAAFRIQYTSDNILILVCLFVTLICFLGLHIYNQNSLRKSHTMNALLNIRNSRFYLLHLRNILRRYPFGNRIPEMDVETLKKERLKVTGFGSIWDSVIYIANYHEFICAGYYTSDFDRRLINETYSNIFYNFYQHVLPIIESARSDGQGYLNKRPYYNYKRFCDEFASQMSRSTILSPGE